MKKLNCSRLLILAALLISMLFCFTGCKSIDYKKAVKLKDQGDTENAVTLFESVGDYKDSREQIKECNYLTAVAAYKSKNYEKAESIFSEMGKYKKSRDYLIFMKRIELHKWLADNGGYTYKDGDDTYEIKTDNDMIYVYNYDENWAGYDSLRFNMYNEKKEIYIYKKISFSPKYALGGSYYDVNFNGQYKWDVTNYTPGGNQDIEIISETNSGKSDLTGNSTPSGARFAEALKAMLGEVDIGITMADIGFMSYDSK